MIIPLINNKTIESEDVEDYEAGTIIKANNKTITYHKENLRRFSVP